MSTSITRSYRLRATAGHPWFQFWDDNLGWVDGGLPAGFAYDNWYSLSLKLAGTNAVMSVTGATVATSTLTYTEDNGGAIKIANVILQGSNTPAGVTYDIYWDNLLIVPEPSSWLLAVCGAAYAFARRKTVRNRCVR